MKLKTALALYLWAKGGEPVGGKLVFSSTTAEFYFQQDGRALGGMRMQDALDDYTAQVKRNIQGHADRLTAGQMSVEEFRKYLKAEMKDAIRVGYITGRGGSAQMTKADWLAVARECKKQYSHVDGFARDLASGQAGTPGQIRVRAGMYGDAPWKIMHAGQRQAKRIAGAAEERRVARMDQGTCGPCAELAGRGWVPIGTLPEPGEGTPCGPNCRCYMDFRGGQPLSEAESAYLLDRALKDREETGFGGWTWDVVNHEDVPEGYSVSFYKDRERPIPVKKGQRFDLSDFVTQHADKLLDQTELRHVFGGWLDKGSMVLDVSVVMDKDDLLGAAEMVVKHKQDAMWSLHERREYSHEECVQLLVDAGRLPARSRYNRGRAMSKKNERIRVERGRRQPLFFVDPKYPGRRAADGRAYTAEEYVGQILDLGEYLHKNHGAESMTVKDGLLFIVRYYIEHMDVDIEDFWEARPEWKPADWDEKKDVYMNGHKFYWKDLAWDLGIDPYDQK